MVGYLDGNEILRRMNSFGAIDLEGNGLLFCDGIDAGSVRKYSTGHPFLDFDEGLNDVVGAIDPR